MSLFTPEDKMNSPRLSELFLNSFSNSCFVVVGISGGILASFFVGLNTILWNLLTFQLPQHVVLGSNPNPLYVELLTNCQQVYCGLAAHQKSSVAAHCERRPLLFPSGMRRSSAAYLLPAS